MKLALSTVLATVAFVIFSPLANGGNPHPCWWPGKPVCSPRLIGPPVHCKPLPNGKCVIPPAYAKIGHAALRAAYPSTRYACPIPKGQSSPLPATRQNLLKGICVMK